MTTNVPGARALFDEVAEALSASPVLPENFTRRYAERRLMEGAEHSTYHLIYLPNEMSITTMRQWLDVAEEVYEQLKCDVAVVGDYDSKIALHFWTSRPFTEKEKQEARDWLAAHPPHLDDRDPIRWRKPVPFVTERS